MDATREEYYLQLAQDRPNTLCSEVPIELLENCVDASDEPTEFLRNLFGVGHLQWLSSVHGQGVRISKDRMNNAIIVLWLRACRLYTSHILSRPDADWGTPFFSDEGLYG